MRLNICQIGEPVLRQKGRELSVEEIKGDYIQHLIQLMKETMYNAPGVGLAAPQVGLDLQLAVLEDREEYIKNYDEKDLKTRERKITPFQVIINPKITLEPGEKVEFFEGCLSAEGFVGLVPRARKVKVECLNEKGEPVVIEASGWHARILQHETDHLFGHVYIDKMYSRSLMTHENYAKHWISKDIKEVKKILGI